MRARRPHWALLADGRGERDGRPGGRAPRRAVAWARALALTVLVGACGTGNPQDALTPRGPSAQVSDDLWDLVFPIAVAVFILVQGLLIVALVRYRARPSDDDTTVPKQVAGNTRLELIWTIVPAIILAGIAIPTVRGIFILAAPPDEPLEVRVVGKQYWWEFEYLGEEGQGVVTANELVIPTGRPVLLQMVATGQQTFATAPEPGQEPEFNWAGGVIHSFWVPSLAGKQDLVPGHTRNLTIEAPEAGTYQGQCAEFCGLSHANMRMAVKATEPADFEAWIETQAAGIEPPTEDLAAQGQALFAGELEGRNQQCIACHGVAGLEAASARQGPDLTNFAARDKFAGYILENNEENLRAWLANPPAVKPGSQMPNLQLTAEEIDALVAYLQTLDPGGATEAAAAGETE